MSTEAKCPFAAGSYAAPIAQAAKIPLISPGATNVEVTAKGNYIFRVCFIDHFQVSVFNAV